MLLVIIHNLRVMRSVGFPVEADTPLIVDTYAVLTFPIFLQCLQPISGWNAQVIQM